MIKSTGAIMRNRVVELYQAALLKGIRKEASMKIP